MDTITHIVLGATLGEVLAGKKLGKKAMWVGAMAQSLPDIDFVASFWLDTSRDVCAHRGITHSFLFLLIMAPLLAWVFGRLYPRSGMSRGAWTFFFGVQLFVHIFLDAFNAYGTAWFEPFSHYRVSFEALFVADPFYSCWLAFSFVALLYLRRDHPARRKWARWGLILSSVYLCYCLLNKWQIDGAVRKDLERQHIHYTRYFTTPTPLNSWLWYVVVEDSTGFYTGYHSVFDRRPEPPYRFFPRNDSLLAPLRSREDVRYLLRFAQGYYTVEHWKDSVYVFNVLRFGEMKGWEDPHAHFVFHYFLMDLGGNAVIVQRGRFKGWTMRTVRAFVRRVKGN